MRKKDLQNSSSSLDKWLFDCMSDKDVLMSEVIIESQEYKNGDLVVLEMNDVNVIQVGLIRSMLLRHLRLYFVCEVFKCIRNSLQFFESAVSYDGFSLILCSDIADYKPLVMRGVAGNFQTVLHHRISHKPE